MSLLHEQFVQQPPDTRESSDEAPDAGCALQWRAGVSTHMGLAWDWGVGGHYGGCTCGSWIQFRTPSCHWPASSPKSSHWSFHLFPASSPCLLCLISMYAHLSTFWGPHTQLLNCQVVDMSLCSLAKSLSQ